MPRSVRIALHIAPILASLLLIFPNIALPETRQSGPSIVPTGLAVVRPVTNSPQNDQSLKQALNNSFISGVEFQIRWRDIEPTQRQLDWSKLDELFAAAESSKKWVQLVIYPGFFTPSWAVEGVKTAEFAIPYGPGRGTVEKLPMPWNSVYLHRWSAFLEQVSDRYGQSPSLR